MASSLQTKLRIAASVIFATGFWDALAGRFLFQVGAAAGARPVAPAAYTDLSGALHIHSDYSDGASDVPTVMRAACEAGVDFVLMTDHNTQLPLRDGWEGRYEGEKPFLLIGTEITVDKGAFLLALDMPPAYEPVKHESPQKTIDVIREGGGIPLVSLPFDVKHPWRDWDADGFVGLEVVNISTVARRHINLFSLLLWLLPLNALRGQMAVLRALLTRPDQALNRWDNLTRGGKTRMIGLGALDAHALMKIGKNKYPIPSYTDSFRTATTHFLVRRDSGQTQRAAVYEALREGRAYIAYDCLGDPRGFTFGTVDGDTVMGERASATGGASVQLRGGWPEGKSKTLLRLYRDGRVVASGLSGGLEYAPDEPGAYRVEVYHYAFRLGPIFFWNTTVDIVQPCVRLRTTNQRTKSCGIIPWRFVSDPVKRTSLCELRGTFPVAESFICREH